MCCVRTALSWPVRARNAGGLSAQNAGDSPLFVEVTTINNPRTPRSQTEGAHTNAMTQANRFAIWEPLHSGHHLFYVRCLLEGIVELGGEGWWVHSGTPETSRACKSQLGEILTHPRAHSITWSGPTDPKHLKRLASRLGADGLILPDGDVHLPGLLRDCMNRGVPTTALVTRDPLLGLRSGQPRARMVGKAILCLATNHLARNTKVIILGSPYFDPAAKIRRFGLGPTVVDPVLVEEDPEFSAAVDRRIQRDARVWLGVAGYIDPRKHIELALEAILASGARRFGLLVAGDWDPDYRKALTPLIRRVRTAGGSVEMIERHLSNAEMTTAIALMDAALILYDTPNPPSTLGKALSVGTLAIVAGPKALRAYARAFPGHAVDGPLEAASISAMIEGVTAGERQQPVRLAGTRDFVAGLTARVR